MRNKRAVVADILMSMSLFHKGTELGDIYLGDIYADLYQVLDAALDAPDHATSEEGRNDEYSCSAECLKFVNALCNLPEPDLQIVRVLLKEAM